MRRILAIDDQQDNLITIKAVLKMLLPDYEVLTADSGNKGLEMAQEFLPDVILLDIIMPGLDGYEVCRALKANSFTQHIPVVMLTALKTDSDSKVKALGLGADAFVTKPFEPVELVAQIKVMLRTKLAEDKLREEKKELNNLVKERTRVLEESEQKYRMLIENTQEPIIVLQKGIVQFANPIATKLSGYSIDEIVGVPFSRFLHPDDKQILLENHKKREEGGFMLPGYEFRVIAKSGKELWFSFKINEIVWQNESALLYLLHNTTDQKEYEKQKRKNTLRSEILLEIHKRAFDLDDEDLYQFVLDKAVAITESKIGFFHRFDEDSGTITLTAWNKETLKTCENPTETHYPIEMAGNWVDCVKEGKPIVYNDFKASPNQKGLPEGHVGLVRYMSIPVFNKGKVYYIFGIGNKEEDYTESDVSSVQLIANEISKILEKRTYEHQIQRSTEKYQAIHNNAPLPFQSLNDGGNIVEVNPAWLKVMGYQMDEVIGKWYGDFLHEDYVEVFKRNFPKLKSVGKVSNVPFKLRTKGGIYIDIKLDGSSSYTSEGEFMQTYCTFKNVSEELKQQKKLEESNRFNRTLLETIPFPIEIVNEEGDILFINSVFEDLVGTDKVGHKCWEVYRDDKQQCEKCPLRKGITIGETNIIEADAVLGGRAFDVIHKSMLFNGEKALMEIFIETTERKKFENELIAAKEKAQESDRLKTAFLANMSHEIRTPMNGILGFTNLLKEPGLTGEDQSRYIDIIIRSGDRMLNTVNDIIEISKIETGQIILTKQKVNVSRHLQTLFQFFQLEAKNKKLDFRLENRISEDDADVITDKNKLSSILTNLIKNALKFTETGFVEIGGSRENEYFRFYVKDSGVGIPEDRLDAVFNRFEQADIDDARVFEGSGLGLAISKSYVEMLDGTISVESKLDKGTTFTVKFPFQMASNNLSVSEQSKVKPRVKRELSILVAEDDEISRYHLEVLLKKISGNLTFVNNGKDAVEKCKNGSFDLILMDIKLPQMDGLEATRHIRSFNSEIIIIAQTAFALHGDKKKALDAGCNGYLSKPLSAERLKESLRANGF